MMESKIENMELLNQAIKNLLEEKRNRDASGPSSTEEDDDHHLLSKLLSQIESLKGNDGIQTQPEEPSETKAVVTSASSSGVPKNESSTEDLAKEIKHLKKQNTITHCLLSAMIILTLTWQLSEFSLILKFKNGLQNPFKSVASVVASKLKSFGKFRKNRKKESSSSSNDNKDNEIEAFKMLELSLTEKSTGKS